MMKKISLRVGILSPLVLFLGCGGGGGNGDVANDPGGSPPKVQRLIGDFTVKNNYSLKGKSTVIGKSADYSNQFTMSGTVEHTVRVNIDGTTGQRSFSFVGNEGTKVNAMVHEVSRCNATDPDDSTMVSLAGQSVFSGPVNAVDLNIGGSALGIGDQLTFGADAVVTGTSTFTVVSPEGVSQTLNSRCAGSPTLLEARGDATPGTARIAPGQSWMVLPALGARPTSGLDAQIHDAVVANPKGFHVGLATSPARDAWSYKGTKVIADRDDANERLLWTEELEVSWRLVAP